MKTAEHVHLPQAFLDVLKLIAHNLQGTPVTWAITGSCALALQGVPVSVHDIDLRSTARDAYVLEARFQAYQKRPVGFARSDTIQSHFGVLEINGIQVEIIGDMQHRLKDGSWEPAVDMNKFKLWLSVGDIKLPVMSLPFLYEAYQALGRTDKVIMLKDWLDARNQH